jgi:hypothetical protein
VQWEKAIQIIASAVLSSFYSLIRKTRSLSPPENASRTFGRQQQLIHRTGIESLTIWRSDFVNASETHSNLLRQDIIQSMRCLYDQEKDGQLLIRAGNGCKKRKKKSIESNIERYSRSIDP